MTFICADPSKMVIYVVPFDMNDAPKEALIYADDVVWDGYALTAAGPLGMVRKCITDATYSIRVQVNDGIKRTKT